MPYVGLSVACDIRATTHHFLVLCDGWFVSKEHFNSVGPTSDFEHSPRETFDDIKNSKVGYADLRSYGEATGAGSKYLLNVINL